MRHLRVCQAAKNGVQETASGLKSDQEKEIEEIIAQIGCPKEFRCYESGLTALCRAKDVGLESLLECLEEDPEGCKFSFAFYGYSYFCQCPVRVYISKKLRK